METFRIRVSGLLVEKGRVLLVRQDTSERKYAVPGGGVNFDETLEAALKREFKEETELTVDIKNIAYISESYKDDNIHVVEVAFSVSRANFDEVIISGVEPDTTDHPISDCQMISIQELESLGLTRLTSFLKDDLIIGKYLGLREK